MKSTLRQYTPVALLLAVIVAVSSCLSLVIGGKDEDGRTRVLATTYPLYVAAQNLMSGTDTLRLDGLAAAGSGCLHDYQLTPADRLAVDRAHVILANGGGAEEFLDGLVDEKRLVDTSAGMELICSDHHHEGEDHHEEYNEHIWVSPQRYAKQVLVVLDTLIAMDPENAAVYRGNAENYLRYVDFLWQEMQAVALSGRPCVLFHNSLSYLAVDLGLDVKLTLTADGESGIAAEALAEVERLAKENPDLILLYDTQYPLRYTAVEALVPAGNVLAMETGVMDKGKTTDWVDAMTENAKKLNQLTGGDAP